MNTSSHAARAPAQYVLWASAGLCGFALLACSASGQAPRDASARDLVRAQEIRFGPRASAPVAISKQRETISLPDVSGQPYRLRPTDELKIQFPAAPKNLHKDDLNSLIELGRVIPSPLFTVGPDGSLDLGFYGRVKVVDKTIEEVTEIVIKRAKEFTKAELIDAGKVVVKLWPGKANDEKGQGASGTKRPYRLRAKDRVKIEFPAQPKNLDKDDLEDLEKLGWVIPSPLVLVGPEGTIDLGKPYGRLKVTNKTIEEVTAMVAKHLKNHLEPEVVDAGKVLVERYLPLQLNYR